MNKPRKYNDARIKAMLNPYLIKKKITKKYFLSDKAKQEFGIKSPEKFFEVETTQQAEEKEFERIMKIVKDLK